MVTPDFAEHCSRKDCKVPNIHLGVMGLHGKTGSEKVQAYTKDNKLVHKARMKGIEYFTWKTGEDLLFDDNYPHFVNVGTAVRRVVLFCDVPRHDMPWLARVGSLTTQPHTFALALTTSPSPSFSFSFSFSFVFSFSCVMCGWWHGWWHGWSTPGDE